MPAEGKRKKTVNGVTRSLLLPKPIDDRLNRLCEATGENRNSLVKLVAETMTPTDVEVFRARSER